MGQVGLLDSETGTVPFRWLRAACGLMLPVILLLFFSTGVSATWYRGNTHSHTLLNGHATSAPEAVAKWYFNRGYNFLVISEHNQFVNPDSVPLSGFPRKNFILIPGEEVTGDSKIHTTALNLDPAADTYPPGAFELSDTEVQQLDNLYTQLGFGGLRNSLVDWTVTGDTKGEIIRKQVDSIRQAGGIPILNHPNFEFGVSAEDVLPVDQLRLMEIYNTHPAAQNRGNPNDQFPDNDTPTEDLWDNLLTRGEVVYGVASDDAHKFTRMKPEKLSNPWDGWIEVRAESLTGDSITESVRNGEFYATGGILLKKLDRTQSLYRVEVDKEKTLQQLKSKWLTPLKTQSTSFTGFRIEFIGPNGQTLKTVHGVDGQFSPGNNDYVRARMEYVREKNGTFEHFFAWTQPVFTDGRLSE